MRRIYKPIQKANTKNVSERQMQGPLGVGNNMPDPDLGPEGFVEEGTSELNPVAERWRGSFMEEIVCEDPGGVWLEGGTQGRGC